MKTARNIAIDVLNQFDSTGNYVGRILDKLLPRTEEKRRATDIVFGCARNRNAIDMLIGKLAECSVSRIPKKLLNIIRIGIYELVYNPDVAEYAIVNEAVENAKTVAGKKSTGFANAVLRQIARNIQNRRIPLSQADTKKTLPVDLLSGCEFKTDILPDVKLKPADYYSQAFSLPKWIIEDWLAELGEEKLRQICFASNRRPSLYVRPNTLKVTVEQLAGKFQLAGIDFEIFEKSLIQIKSKQAVALLPGFIEGLFTVQDMTAWRAVGELKLQPDWKILDLCSAPGTKTTQLAELTGDKAEIIAADIDNERLTKVKENIERLGINSVKVVKYKNLEDVVTKAGLFDYIMLDVPCSNTGVLAKRPEVRYRIQLNAIESLAQTQMELLTKASAMLKPQGRILYSTCSIQKQENCGLVRKFLGGNPNFKLESEKLTLPSAEGFDHDGGYTAIMEKVENKKGKSKNPASLKTTQD
jgi:16S rRNA (cytosine967-C5)-methyltransferase